MQHERSQRVGEPLAVVLAFDGVVADTLPARATSLGDALRRSGIEGVPHSGEAIDRAVAGRTFAESVRVIMSASTGEADETMIDLIALDAARRYSATVAHGASLADNARETIARYAGRTRIVVRADSTRGDVEGTLALSGLDSAFTFVRCSDDQPRVAGASSVDASWAAISARLAALGIPREQTIAIEVGAVACAAAARFAAGITPHQPTQ